MAYRFVVSFTETSLGRFLRAVEVYLLIVHSLHTTFQAFSAPSLASSKFVNSLITKPLAEKFAVADTLPYAYANQTQGLHNHFHLAAPSTTQSKSGASRILPRRNSAILVGNEHELLGRDTKNLEEIVAMVDSNKIPGGGNPLGTAAAISPTKPQPQAPSPNSISTTLSSKQLSLSYCTVDQSSGEYITSKSSTIPPKESELKPTPRVSDSDKPLNVSPQGSITSIDELFRQQTELDKSIAALRLFSMQTHFSSNVAGPSDGTISTVATRSRSTLTSHMTESLSNRSDFSLSVFPAPPIVPVDEVATKYPSEGAHQGAGQRGPSATKGQKEKGKDFEPPSSSKYDRVAKVDSAATQFDVTSFING